jgi:2,3-diketo-5-methylthio-1-phosphopentane phosphatase
MKREMKVFVDFDGTITRQDVGDSMFRRFGDPVKVNEVIGKLLADEITARECWVQLCLLADRVVMQDLMNFFDEMEIDGSFHDFVSFCKEKSIRFFVLSDGFDLYIDRIFKREGLYGIQYFANILKLTPEGGLTPSFPYFDSSCRVSANCKKNHIINNSSDDEVTVFIGDGYSDKESIQYCDYIFAKDDLLKFCESERISYYPFRNFSDVINRLDSLLSKRNLKKRHQAEIKRKEAYTIE